MMRTEERSRKQEYDPSIRSKRSETSLNGRPSFTEQRPGSAASNRPLPPPPFDAGSTHATDGLEEEEMEPLPQRRSREAEEMDVVWRGSVADPKHFSTHSSNSGSRTAAESIRLMAPSPTQDLPDPQDLEQEEVADIPPPPSKMPLPSPISMPPIPAKDPPSKYDSIMAERAQSPGADSPGGTPSYMSDRVSKLVQMYTTRSHIPVAAPSLPSMPVAAHKPLPIQQH
jgi:hypothetical protein